MEFLSPSERGPDADGLRREILERLPDSPALPTEQAMMAWAAFRDGSLEAHVQGSQSNDGHEAMRILAYLLAFAIDSGSALRRFGLEEASDTEAALAECEELLSRATLYPDVREAANWLAAHLVYQLAPEVVPARLAETSDWQHVILQREELGLSMALHSSHEVLPGDEVATTHLVMREGIPAIAHLRRPFVDCTSENLEDEFLHDYVGEFANITDAFDSFVRMYPVREDASTGPQTSYRHLPRSVQDEVRQMVGARFEFVPHSGRIHAFRRKLTELHSAS